MIVIGEKIGHYKVQSSIGAGGMGEIYRASDTRLRRDVAIKILPESLMRDASAIERFRREADAASALNHPNILTIFDIGEHAGNHFIATEFVEGETLRQKMQDSRLRLAEILDVAIQTANALVAAHEAGIVHRDIKPENIMIRRDGYVKVLDFGIAKLTDRRGDAETRGHGEEDNTLIAASPFPRVPVSQSTSPGMILGTPFYMSPEQARGLAVDARGNLLAVARRPGDWTRHIGRSRRRTRRKARLRGRRTKTAGRSPPPNPRASKGTPSVPQNGGRGDRHPHPRTPRHTR